MSDDYFSYQADRLSPKPSHQRSAPTRDALKKLGLNQRVAEVVKHDTDSYAVEETNASDSMIMRIIGKIRGG